MREHLADYEEHLLTRGLTPEHIQSILFQLNEFFRFVGSEAITRAKISAYQSYLAKEALNHRGEPFSPRLLAKRLYALRRFFQWLTQRKFFLMNPARNLEGLKVPRPLPAYVPSHDEIKQMIESIPKIGYGLRDRAILELLYSTGIRAGELLHLSLYDIDLEGKRVLVRQGKGSKDRVVPLGEKALAALQDYLNLERPRRKAKVPATSLFLTRSGKPLTYAVLIQTIARYRANPGIRPHTIRHATALGMLKMGADIRHIQELLGHDHLETTQIYTRLFPQDLQEIHQKYHPREHRTKELRTTELRTKELRTTELKEQRKKEVKTEKIKEKKDRKPGGNRVRLLDHHPRRQALQRAGAVVKELVPILGLERTIASSRECLR